MSPNALPLAWITCPFAWALAACTGIASLCKLSSRTCSSSGFGHLLPACKPIFSHKKSREDHAAI